MAKTGRSLIIILLLVFSNICVFASFEAGLILDEREVVKGRAFKFTVEVKGDFSNTERPDITLPDTIRVLSQSKNQSINIVNWEKSVSHSFVYQAVALKTGKYNIGPVKIKVDGMDIDIKPETITVIEAKEIKRKGAAAPSDNVLSWIEVDKGKYFVGEQLSVKVIFAHRDVRIRNLTFSEPQVFQDFISFKREEKEFSTEIKGRRYNVLQLTYPLIPLRAGNYHFDDAQITYDIIKKSSDFGSGSTFGDSFFDDFFNPFDMEKRMLIPDGDTFEVVDVPTPPKNFSGGVGKFIISAKKYTDEFLQGEPFEFDIFVSGIGNIDNIEKPIFSGNDDYSVSYTGDQKDVNTVKGKITGGKKFSYVIIPEKSGKITIESAAFVFFDPDKEEYITVESKPFEIDVEENEEFVKSESTVKDYSDINVNNSSQAVSTGADIEFIFTGRGLNFDRILKNLSYIDICLFFLSIMIYISKPLKLLVGSSKERRLSRVKDRLKEAFKNERFYQEFSMILEELIKVVEDENVVRMLKDKKTEVDMKAYSGKEYRPGRDELAEAIEMISRSFKSVGRRL